MSRARAATGTIVFLVVAPGVVAGLIPWLLTGWESNDPWWPVRVLGIAVIAAGAAVLLQAFGRFALEGLGTPAPVAPTARLVIGGSYRYVRNPMYLAVGSLILGQALLLGQAVLFGYLVLFCVTVVSFVRLYEEPTLTEQFGEEYEAYRAAVPGWWPRRAPWTGDSEQAVTGSPRR